MIYHNLKYLLSFFFFVCLAFNAEAQSTNDSYKILFIGNSLTYTNDLPDLIKTKAKYSVYHIEAEMIALPNYAISDHWKKGEVQKLIQSNHYDVVILQQGPSSQSRGKKILLDYGKKYSALCEENNTLLAFFMVWPSLDHYETFDGVIENYTLAAETYNAILCPVGTVWKDYFETSRKFNYYGSDSFHPSKKGSEVAAKVILKSVLKHLK